MKYIAALLLVAACASNPTPAPSPAPHDAAALGTSCDNAIVIDARNEDEGIKAEYAWIRQHYPGSRTGAQDLLNCDGKHVDRIEFTDAGGNKGEVFFDISGWFGKR